LGLLVAFTFSGAAGRFDTRRQLIIEETNAIGTAWLRIDLLPATEQPLIRDLFRNYLDARLGMYRDVRDAMNLHTEYQRSLDLQQEIWNRTVAISQTAPDVRVATVVLPALNEMFDVATKRIAALNTRVPNLILGLLFLASLGCAVMGGLGSARLPTRNWLHVIGFTIVTSMTVFVILDLEQPRLGVMRVDSTDQLLRDLRRDMERDTR
jgi:hypothetical protein